MPDGDTVEQFLSNTKPMMDGANDGALAADQPKVPFQTQLKLTGTQEKKLIEQAFKRMREISNENGRDQTINPTWWMNLAPSPNLMLASQGLLPQNTFLGKRSRYDATFYNDVSWRPWTMGPDNIFTASNLVVPLSRRICRQMIARAQNSFFGTEPWFSVEPAPEPARDLDSDLALEIERFTRFKLHESASKNDKMRAIQRALILGECAVKTNYVVRDQLFNVEAMVLTDVDGQPIMGADGNTITHDDQWKDAEDGTGQQVLARDGQTPQPDAPIYQNIPLNRRQVLFEGARSEPIYYKDFLCPMTACDVQTADCIVHLYDKAVMEFVDLVVKRGMVDDSTQGRLDATQKMIALIQQMSENSSEPKAAMSREQRPNENFATMPDTTSSGPVAEFAEFYLWFDANGDGVAENIMLIADRKTQAPVFYDHVANVTTDGLRPIEIVRINPIEGRWYGQGIMELFESYQTVTDLMVNRWNFSQSRSGRVDLWDPTATLEGDRDPNLKMNWGGTYSKKPGKKKEDVIETVYLNDTKFEQIQTMIQFFMQLAMNESGVTNANDNLVAGMEQAKLATGIVQIEKSGDELFMPIISDLTAPLTRLVNREISVTLANMNPEEVYTYSEGDDLQLGQLTPDQVRGLRFKITINLTTHRNQQLLQMSAQAAALVEKFYMLPPNIQPHVAQFYRAQIRALDPKADVDSIITVQPMPPPGMLGQPAGGGPPGMGEPPPGTTAFPTQMGQQHSQPKGISAG